MHPAAGIRRSSAGRKATSAAASARCCSALRDGRKLTYAGKVGTGFNTKMIDELMERMEPLEIDKAAVEVPRADRKGAHWLEPKLVAEIAFTEFTDDGILRHPSFIALREDKPAKEVVREMPKKLKKAEKKKAEARDRRELRDQDQQPRPRDLSRSAGLTKRDLADYYAQIEALMMVDAADRPMTLIRCPQGTRQALLLPEARQRHDGRARQAHPDQGEGRRRSRTISISTTSAGCSPASRWGRSSSTAGAARSTRSNIPTGWCSTSIPTSGSISAR